MCSRTEFAQDFLVVCAGPGFFPGCFHFGPFVLGFRLVVEWSGENRLPHRVGQRTEDLARGGQVAGRDVIHQSMQLTAISFAGMQFLHILDETLYAPLITLVGQIVNEIVGGDPVRQ
jgi:hypothetical protein